jgi:hypothetical protein
MIINFKQFESFIIIKERIRVVAHFFLRYRERIQVDLL